MKRFAFIFGFLALTILPFSSFAQDITKTDPPSERTTIYWAGGFSNSWGAGINWEGGIAPGALDNVYISTAHLLNYNPRISSTQSFSCNSVYLGPNTTLTLQGSLTTTYDFTCYGTLTMNNEQADLNVGDDLSFQNGSELNIPYPGSDINITDDLYCYSGCDVHPDYGDFKFTGPNSNLVINVDVEIYNLYIDSADCQRSSGGGLLGIRGGFSVYASRSYTSSVSAYTSFYGTVWVASTGYLTFTAGYAAFTGSMTSQVTLSYFSKFHHVSVQKNAGTYVTLLSDIIIWGDLYISGGILDSNNHDIEIHGNWTEYIGPDGFDESAGTTTYVYFSGTTSQTISGFEEFNGLYNENNSGSITIGNAAQVTADYYAHFNRNLVVSTDGSFQATVNTTVYSGLAGNFSISGYLDLTLDPAQDSDITGSVVINPGGEFHIHGGASPCHLQTGATLIPNGLLYFHDIGLEILEDAYGSMNSGDIYVTGDFRVYEIYYSLYGGTVHLVGSGDSYFLPPSSGFTGLHINKESTNDDVHIQTRGFTLMGEFFLENGNLWMEGYDMTLHSNSQIGDQVLMLGGSVYIAPNMELAIVDGGWLALTGSSGDLSYVSRIGSSGYYDLTVESGGQLGAEYTVFEYMGLEGINLQAGSNVRYEQCFEHCTFRYGADAGTLLTINTSQNILLYGVSFPANTWGGNFNVTKNNDEGNVLFVMAAGGFSGAANESDSYNRIDWGTTIPPVTDLDIWYWDIGNGQVQLEASFPYAGAKYTLYKSNVGPDGPWDVYSSGSTSDGAIWTYSPTEPMAFFRIILWQE